MKNNEKKKRAPNLTEERIAGILFIIDRWSEGRLTWDALIDAIERSTQVEYTRQALAKHELVQAAYAKKNEYLAQGPSVKKHTGIVELDQALLIIETQRAEIARLKKAEALFLEQFARWAANAHMQGIDYWRLDSPLDAVDRDSSLVHKRSLKSVA
ncbi:hypothetical protein [Massilia sp. YIM B02443]|uniref:hypothetical protein n=1 Tax=Massilia sp. YIM B02443 TaxID=3050127 RepID=UPI0025B62BCD|nr:hypothetical protein [Massilia sp. YIM B02443]MDN4035879.1 hypothetical protein [Massilia sp. YIM B02443]